MHQQRSKHEAAGLDMSLTPDTFNGTFGPVRVALFVVSSTRSVSAVTIGINSSSGRGRGCGRSRSPTGSFAAAGTAHFHDELPFKGPIRS
jgi:hypothetical protein